MYFSKLSVCAFVLFGASQAATISTFDTTNTNKCQNLNTDFTKGLGTWTAQTNGPAGWAITNNGLEMHLNPPQTYEVKNNVSDSNLPYNTYTSPNYPVFSAPQKLHFGKVTYTLKTSGIPGVVTAAILMSSNGDEIDFEMLGGDTTHVQTNFFYGEDIVYNVNSKNSPSVDTSSGFHSYTIDWSPDRIQFSIDNKIIQTHTKQSTCDSTGICHYPSHAANVQFGIWDASSPSGTAQWARGPINWKTAGNITAIFKSVSIECNTQYNHID